MLNPSTNELKEPTEKAISINELKTEALYVIVTADRHAKIHPH